MNYFSEYEQERFNQMMYYNRYYDYEDEIDDNEEEEEQEDYNKNKKEEKNSNNDSFFDDMKENKKKINIYFPNNSNDNKDSEEEKYNIINNINEYNQILIKNYKSEINKKYNPNNFPRPKTSDLIYNNHNKNIYFSKTLNYNSIPSVISSFINKEEINSSLKLIRPTQHVIPYKLKEFEKTINLFGFNIEPFAINTINTTNNNNDLEYIPIIKIKLNNGYMQFAQCKNCNGLYHHYSCICKIIKINSIDKIYSYNCTICRNQSNIVVREPELKDNYEKYKKKQIYFIPKIDNIKENSPSIEYLINKNKTIRYTIQIIIIEINRISFNNNIIEYIYQSLYQIIKENYLNSKEYDKYIKYSLIVYDKNNIYFMYLNNKINKNLEIKIMNDSIHPFCPLSKNKLFNNKNDFLILLEKFQQWLYIYKIINSNINNININTVIKSLIYLCNNNYKINNDDNFYYHHLILFTLSYPNIDLNYLKNSSHLKFYISLFYPSNLMYKNIPFINNIFIYNIQIYYYQIDYKQYEDIKQKYEKIYYDLYSLLSNNSYTNYIYDIIYHISYDKSIFYNKINKNNDSIHISFIPNKNHLSIIYILPQFGYPDLIQRIIFQFKIEYYTNIDNYLHIRILSWNNHVSDKTNEIYSLYDQDCLFRVTLLNFIYDLFLKENKSNNIYDINLINKIYVEIKNKKEFSSFYGVEKNFRIKIENSIIKYRKEVNYGKDFNMIIIPPMLNNIILYYYSFIKQIIFGENLNLFNLLFSGNINIFIKNIYPNILNLLYSQDNKIEKFYLKPSTIYNLVRNQLLLIDNGMYIYILINDKIDINILNHFFHNFEIIDKNKYEIEFCCENNYIKNITLNKPIQFIFINENNILDNKILNNFIEDYKVKNIKIVDKINGFEDLSYFEFFFQIQNNISSYMANIK